MLKDNQTMLFSCYDMDGRTMLLIVVLIPSFQAVVRRVLRCCSRVVSGWLHAVFDKKNIQTAKSCGNSLFAISALTCSQYGYPFR